MHHLTEALAKLYETILTKEKTEIHLKNIDRVLLEQEELLKENLRQMEQEARDVTRLESKNLYSIFHFILGNKAQQVEKERQEYLQCYLQTEALKNNIISLKNERELLLKSYSSKFNVEQKFDDLIKNKEQQLKEAAPKLADHIIEYEERIANHQTKMKEINQAIKEGRKVIRITQRTLLHLEKIDVWGQGSKNSKRQKSNLTRAKDKIQKDITLANNYLHKFEEELYDVSDQYGLDYHHQVNEIKGFIHKFYDSLITDWVVKERIEHSTNVLKNLSDKLERIIAMLNHDKHQTRNFIQLEKKDQRNLIMKELKKTKTT